MQKYNTLADYFSKHASSSKFIFEIETGKKKSHKDLLDNAKKLAANFQIRKGDVATVILPNSIEYIEYFIASMLRTMFLFVC